MVPLWLAMIYGALFAVMFFCIIMALSKAARKKVDFVPQYSAEDIKAGLELCKSILAIHEKQRQLEIENIEANKKWKDPKPAEFALKKDRIETELEKWHRRRTDELKGVS